MPRKSWREALATYANPATLALLPLGFAAGLPYMLVFSYPVGYGYGKITDCP